MRSLTHPPPKTIKQNSTAALWESRFPERRCFIWRSIYESKSCRISEKTSGFALLHESVPHPTYPLGARAASAAGL